AQPHHPGLRMALRAKPRQVRLGRHFHQAPRPRIKTPLRIEVHDSVTYVADIGYPAHAALLQIGCAASANISAVALALSTGGASPSCPWQIARLVRTIHSQRGKRRAR